jgi:hypothetical protein
MAIFVPECEQKTLPTHLCRDLGSRTPSEQRYSSTKKAWLRGMASGLLAEPSILVLDAINDPISFVVLQEFTLTLNQASLLMWMTFGLLRLQHGIPSVVALDWELVIKFVLFRPRNCTKSYKALGGPQHAYDTYPHLHLSISSPRGAYICISRMGILSRDMQRDPLPLCSPSIPAVIRSISGYPTFEALLFSSAATAWSSDPREPT